MITIQAADSVICDPIKRRPLKLIKARNLTFAVLNNFCRSNFSDVEIEMFFCRSDIDGNVFLDRNETNKVLNDLGEQNRPETRPGNLQSVSRI